MDIIFENDLMQVTIDEKSGNVKSILSTCDNAKMNWVLPGGKWGSVKDFSFTDLRIENEALYIKGKSEKTPLKLLVTRKADKEYYTESYEFINESESTVTVDRGSLGILFSFNSSIEKSPDFLSTKCNAHVWCGGNTAWLYGEKLNGCAPYLIIEMTQGDCCDYSVLSHTPATSSITSV